MLMLRPSSPRRTVLVVDDDPAIARLIDVTLSQAQIEVQTAFDGASAFRAVRAQHPDLMVLDLQLPDVDGRELFWRLRRSGFIGPVLILSAQARAARRELGAEAALEKPFDPLVMLHRVEILLQRP